MVVLGRIVTEIQIPEGITSVKVDRFSITVKAKSGELTRDFAHTKIEMTKVDDKIILTAYYPRKKDKALLNTVRSHINNMFDGLLKGYEYKMKIVFSHFPIRVSVDKKTKLVKIENLYGGRKPRFANILGKVNVKVDGEDVIVSGIDKEDVGQTCANIQELTRQRGKRRQSPKTFMDGIFVFQRGFKPEY